MATTTYFDDAWYPLVAHNNAQYRRRFRLHNYEAMKNSFVRGDFKVMPQYAHIRDSRYDEKMERLTTARIAIAQTKDLHPAVKDLYEMKLLEKQLILELVKSAACAGQKSPEQKQAISDFTTATAILFTTATHDIFHHIVLIIQARLAALSHNKKLGVKYELLQATFGSLAVTTTIPAYEQKESLVTDISEEVFSDADALKLYIEKKLTENDLAHWHVVVSKHKSGSFLVLPSKRTVKIPKSSILQNRKHHRALTRRVADGIVAHEILTHVIRCESGAASPLRLLGVGLPYYLRGEEGIATYREQLITGADDYAGLRPYLAISLASGLDRCGSKRTMAEIFTLLVAYFEVLDGYTPKGAASKAFALCSRSFVFIESEYPLILTRDLLYREGNIGIHELLRRNPQAASTFDIGKFDPLNNEHVSALSTLGLL